MQRKRAGGCFGSEKKIGTNRLGLRSDSLTTKKEEDMKTILKIAIALGFMSAVTACNTIDGVGKDVEVAGEEIQDAAD